MLTRNVTKVVINAQATAARVRNSLPYLGQRLVVCWMEWLCFVAKSLKLTQNSQPHKVNELQIAQLLHSR